MLVWMRSRAIGFACTGLESAKASKLVGWCGSGCWRWSGLGGRWPDGRAHEEEEIQEEDRDEDEASDEDMRTKSHIRLVLREVRRRDVPVFVLVIMHAYQLRRKAA